MDCGSLVCWVPVVVVDLHRVCVIWRHTVVRIRWRISVIPYGEGRIFHAVLLRFEKVRTKCVVVIILVSWYRKRRFDLAISGIGDGCHLIENDRLL